MSARLVFVMGLGLCLLVGFLNHWGSRNSRDGRKGPSAGLESRDMIYHVVWLDFAEPLGFWEFKWRTYGPSVGLESRG